MLVVVGLIAVLAQSALAFRPSGWVYINWPWAFEAASGDWHWFKTDDTQWVNGPATGGWQKMAQSALASGWSFCSYPHAYCAANNAWYYISEADTQWVVNMRTGAWSLFGLTTASDGDYMVIDLSGGPSASSYPVGYLSAVPSGGWTDAYKTTKLVLRRISAGTFTMGSPTNELGRGSNEIQHQVTLTQDFYIGVFEVTQKQWERVMGNKPSYFTNASCYASRPVEQVSYHQIRENADSNTAISPNWPQSSAAGAGSFIGKLRAKTGLMTLDLPTESQWEYAGRAGTTTALNSGKNLTNAVSCSNMSEVGRYEYNHPGGYSFSPSVNTDGGSAKVGSYLPNAWGLYDMHGNVHEMCLDWYTETALGSIDPSGAVSGDSRVSRDGSWPSIAMHCRSGVRHPAPPHRYSGGHGFRLSRTLP